MLIFGEVYPTGGRGAVGAAPVEMVGGRRLGGRRLRGAPGASAHEWCAGERPWGKTPGPLVLFAGVGQVWPCLRCPFTCTAHPHLHLHLHLHAHFPPPLPPAPHGVQVAGGGGGGGAGGECRWG